MTVAAHGQPFWQALRPDPISNPDDDWGPTQPDPTGERWTDVDLAAVHFATDEVGYVVGAGGEVLKTLDAGDTWERKRLTSGGSSLGDLYGVHVVSAGVDDDGEPTGEDVVVAVGQGGLVLRTVDGGATWRRSVVRAADGRTLDFRADLNSVHFGSEDFGLAVGNRLPDPDKDLYTVLRTDDGGRTWERLDSPNTSPGVPPAGNGRGDLLAVDLVDELTGVVVGVGPRYLRTDDGGDSWTSIDGDAASPVSPRDVALLRDGEDGGATGYAVGNNGGLTGLLVDSVRRTTDGFQDAGNSEVEFAGRELFGVEAYLPTDAAAGVEVAHAVGWHGYLESALFPSIGVVMTRTVGAGSGSGMWVVEPVDDWARNPEVPRAVSASPGGGTVVAVGDGGLMLRRNTDPTEAPDRLCVPRVLADLAQPPEVPMCPDPAEREDGEVGDPVDGPLALSDDVAEPGDGLRAAGEGWLVCDGGDCRGSQVTLWFVQDGREPVRLGDTIADERGELGMDFEVPRAASPGVPTVVRAVGEPSGGDERVAEAELTVPDPGEPVSPPGVHAPDVIRQGRPLTVTGTDWRVCRPTCEGSAVHLTLEQGSRSFDLGLVSADSYGRFTHRVELPADAELADGVIRASGTPPPDLGATAASPVEVQSACWLTAEQMNPDLACLDDFQLVNEDGSPRSIAGDLQVRFVAGIGEANPETGEASGRLVAVDDSRIYLYDVAGLAQRGVPGFGDHFGGRSADGAESGVVNLDHAESAQSSCEARCRISGRPGAPLAVDTENHRLYFSEESGADLENDPERGVGGRSIVAMSLTGEFPPVAFRIDDLPGHRVTHIAVDSTHSVLYAATMGGDGATQVAGTRAPQRDVMIHAIPLTVQDGELVVHQGGERGWSYHVGNLCDMSDVSPNPLNFFGLSADGRRLHLPCAGASFTFYALMPPRPSGIVTVTLPDRPPPDELSAGDTNDFVSRYTPVPGDGPGPGTAHRVFGDQNAGVLVWRSGPGVYVWDLDEAMWLGRATFRAGEHSTNRGANLVAADPGGVLYLAGGGDIPVGALAYMQVTNLPGDVTSSAADGHVDSGLREGDSAVRFNGWGIGEGGAFDPETRRIVAHRGASLVVLEDRIAPPIPETDSDPDAATNDIDEAEAFSVDRRGDTSAYGTRLWSTGLRGSLPGTYTWPGDGERDLPGYQDLDEPTPPAGLTYDWLWRSSTTHGEHTSRTPSSWRPYPRDRELVSARVLSASLQSGDTALTSRSSGRSRAQATGLDVDGGTDDDLRRRRGAREWRDVIDVYVREGGCSLVFLLNDDAREECEAQADEHWRGGPEDEQSGYDQWDDEWTGEDAQRFDDCVDELYDRMLREVSGQRQVDACADFAGFDEWDPRDDPAGLEQHLGLTQRSGCVTEGTGAPEGASRRGSTVLCDVDGQRTVALAENAFGDDEDLLVELPGGVTVRVEASFTLTHSYLDPDRGMVSEANAFAQGVELSVPGVGTLRIGQVATRAETWAAGRPETAGSEYSVSYSDVELSGPAGMPIFACDPRGDVAFPVDLPADDDEGDEDGSGVACDVEEVAFRANHALGGVVELSVPARDLDERMVGTTGGAQARVQRNRADYWNDRVLFGVDQDEVSGLQIRMVADGTDFNRYRVDLAGVFAGSSYQIGQRWEGRAELPGSLAVSLNDHDGNPLAGGRFQVVVDAGGGVPGEAVASCVTGPDGEGDCRFPALEPGQYLVHQTSAPEGYLRQVDPARVSVSRGLTSTVEFVNIPDGAGVEITLVNPAGERLEGGVFELAHESGTTASCITDAPGTCEFTSVPLGEYTLTQPTAPEGYEPTDPVAFTLAQPGQVARITVVNGPPGSAAGGATVEIIEIIEGADPTASTGGNRNPFGMFRDAVADAFGFLVRHPLQALLFLMLFAVLFAPLYGLARRMDLIAAEEAT